MFNLPYVPTSDDLIDKAFSHGAKSARAARSTNKPREKRMKKSEEERIRVAGGIIEWDLKAIIKGFPSYDQLPTFYQRLLELKVNKDRYKKSLGAVQWCLTNIVQIKNEAFRELKFSRDPMLSKAFFGRAASMVKRISKDLDDLIEIKAILRDFPMIEDMPTMVISGYPNVGKSTFMRNLTGSEVKIASYPFTTQSILIGHRMIGHQRYAVIDSPGILDRPLEQRNEIEMQAILAIEELADVILFMIDPTMEIEPQLSLLEEIRKGFDLKIFVALNKGDVANEEAVNKITEALKGYTVYTICANDKEDCIRVFKDIFKPG